MLNKDVVLTVLYKVYLLSSRRKNLILEHQDHQDRIRICHDQLVYMCVCCVVIQVGVLDTGRGSRLVIR